MKTYFQMNLSFDETQVYYDICGFKVSLIVIRLGSRMSYILSGFDLVIDFFIVYDAIS